MIMAGGAPGKRFALPNAKLMIHQGSAGFRGAPERHLDRRARGRATTRQMAEIIARPLAATTVERVMEDIDRDRFMTPAEAVEYGLVDEILVSPRNRAEYDRGVTSGGSTISGSRSTTSTRPSRRTRGCSPPRSSTATGSRARGSRRPRCSSATLASSSSHRRGTTRPSDGSWRSAAPACTTSPTRSTTSEQRSWSSRRGARS